MGTKVKGLLRGLKQISQIFDGKEPEMEIGFPTDVKHVAHIGCEGPSATAPSWMDEFKGTAETADPQVEVKSPGTNPPPEDYTLQSEKSKPRSRRPPSAGSGSPSRKSGTDAPRSSRRHHSGPSAGSPVSSPRGPDSSRHSRRRRSASNVPMDSPSRDPLGSGKSSKQYQPSALGSESPARDPSIPKHSRGKKSKGSSSGSVKSKSKDRSSSKEEAALDNGTEGANL